MPNWLAKNALTIPGKRTYPSDQRIGKRCPHCGRLIFILVPKRNPYTGKIELVCPACGKKPK